MVLFERLVRETNRRQVRLVHTPFWLKVGPCPPKCDKKDLLHVIGSTFGGILGSEVKREYCRLRVSLDVQKPLKRGIFVYVGEQGDR